MAESEINVTFSRSKYRACTTCHNRRPGIVLSRGNVSTWTKCVECYNSLMLSPGRGGGLKERFVPLIKELSAREETQMLDVP